MNPSLAEVERAIRADDLDKILRGEALVFETPSHINAEAIPTDHSELLTSGLYPLATTLKDVNVIDRLEKSLVAITHDALGTFCALQCFYIIVLHEDRGQAPMRIHREALALRLGAAFQRNEASLRSLEIRPGDAGVEACYRLTLAGMKILADEHAISWGITLPNL